MTAPRGPTAAAAWSASIPRWKRGAAARASGSTVPWAGGGARAGAAELPEPRVHAWRGSKERTSMWRRFVGPDGPPVLHRQRSERRDVDAGLLEELCIGREPLGEL